MIRDIEYCNVQRFRRTEYFEIQYRASYSNHKVSLRKPSVSDGRLIFGTGWEDDPIDVANGLYASLTDEMGRNFAFKPFMEDCSSLLGGKLVVTRSKRFVHPKYAKVTKREIMECSWGSIYGVSTRTLNVTEKATTRAVQLKDEMATDTLHSCGYETHF
ncbi:hypothetical protein CPB86DRAFT_800303 [Serendipita vermifera]|nr:hypothetical protein CPB86DRAFT_800303 [Serendipita vermifera]